MNILLIALSFAMLCGITGVVWGMTCRMNDFDEKLDLILWYLKDGMEEVK